MNEPRDHHYVPQFFLRNFAIDSERKKLTTVAKHGDRAIWAERSIAHLGYERDLYVYLRGGIPVSVETEVNRQIETPISQSDTWAKIASGRTDTLDISDKPILYALIRHLEARNPHYLWTMQKLAELSANLNPDVALTNEEREMYSLYNSSPDQAKAHFNAMSASLTWTQDNYQRACMSILRSPIPLRSSTTPVLPLRAPAHSALYLPLPGMVPFQLLLTLNRNTAVSLVFADFDGGFLNLEVTADVAKGLNRQFAGQFAYFAHVRHLITGKLDLIADMTWAPYDLAEDGENRTSFRRRERDSG